MSPREHRSHSCANNVCSYFWNMSKIVLQKNCFLLRLHLMLSAVAGNGLHTQMAKPQRLIHLKLTRMISVMQCVYLNVRCSHVIKKLSKQAFWRRKKIITSQIAGIWYLGLHEVTLYIWCITGWVCGVPARPENRGLADGCFMPIHMRKFYFVLWNQ